MTKSDLEWFDSNARRTAATTLIDSPSTPPRFIACHLFAYNTTLADVTAFVKTLDAKKVKVVRADEFLFAAKQFMQRGEKK